jgi:hypothetical protein
MSNGTYVKTDREMCEILDIATSGFVQNWKRRADFPKKTAQGWNVLQVQEYIRNAKEQQQAGISGRNADLVREKLRLECMKLQTNIAILRREAIPISEHNAELAEYASMVNGVFDQWVDRVMASTRDKKLIKAAQDLATRARKRLERAIEKG